MKRFFRPFLMFGLLTTPVVYAQTNVNTPKSIASVTASQLLPAQDIPQVVLNSPNITTLLAEDKAELAKPNPMFRMGALIPSNIQFPNSGSLTVLADGSKVWQAKVMVSNTKALGLYYDNFSLPEGVKYFVFNGNGKQVLGAFTADANPDGGSWATEKTQGELVNIELDIDAEADISKINFHINNVCVFYKGTQYLDAYATTGALAKTTIDFPYNGSSPCEINAICSQGSSFVPQRKATVHIEYVSGNYAYAGTGTLMNNTNNDCTPYVLTASHVEPTNSTSNTTYANWIFYFNYEAPTCTYTGTIPTITQTVTGAAFRARASYNSASSQIVGDFLLVELRRKVPVAYDAYFSGWDRTGTTPAGSVIGFHHPSGDIKKLAVAPAALPNGNFNGGQANSHWHATFTTGGIEEGSSGSGLFDPNGRLIGDLTGAPNQPGACTDTNSTGTYMAVSSEYSKLSLNWLYVYQSPSSSTTHLSVWLDSIGTGATTLNAISANCPALAVSPVNALAGNDINVYPNPANGLINISTNFSTNKRLAIGIYNMLGALQEKRSIDVTQGSFSIDCSSYPAGVYLLQFNGDNFAETKRVSVVH